MKLEEKRNALRQAVKLLENQTNKLQDETIALRTGKRISNTRGPYFSVGNFWTQVQPISK